MKRRDFIKTAAAGAAIVAAGSSFAQAAPKAANIKCKGYAAFDESGVIKPWAFERRALLDDDILIEVMATSICHSDIHTEKGHWGKQIYPQVPGHEIVGIVREVGSKVTKFKVGDRAGVGCMVDNTDYKTATINEQQSPNTIYTYGQKYKKEPTGISQGGYSDYFVVNENFGIHIPEGISWEEAAPLMCAGITTYSPIMKYMKSGDNVAIIGIGGLGHLGIKIAVSKGAKVTAFTTTAAKAKDIESWGAKAVVVKSAKDLEPFEASFDFALSTIPYKYDMDGYLKMVKPFGTYTLVGVGKNADQNFNILTLADWRVNLTASKIGGIKETQEMTDYCVQTGIVPNIVKIKASQITQAWKDVENKKARYRFVIDPKTF